MTEKQKLIEIIKSKIETSETLRVSLVKAVTETSGVMATYKIEQLHYITVELIVLKELLQLLEADKHYIDHVLKLKRKAKELK